MFSVDLILLSFLNKYCSTLRESHEPKSERNQKREFEPHCWELSDIFFQISSVFDKDNVLRQLFVEKYFNLEI